MGSDDDELPTAKSGNTLITLVIIGVLIFAGFWLFGKTQDAIRPKSWTLFIYKSETPDTDYEKARIDTYNSQTACIEKGITFTGKGGSFECGYDCRFRKEYLMEICDKICGLNGCRD